MVKTIKKVYINPPPFDERCECCRRHISELEPFEGPGDYKGAFLVKSFRPLCGEGQVDASWECKDCCILDHEAYMRKRFKSDVEGAK